MNAIAKSYFHRGGENPLLGTTISEHFLSKIPKYIRFVDAFPMTVTGKLQKFKMRETMQDFLQQETTAES